MIEPHWEFKKVDEESVINLADTFDLPTNIAQVMSLRGINSRTQSKSFFYPNIDQLHNPFLKFSLYELII